MATPQSTPTPTTAPVAPLPPETMPTSLQYLQGESVAQFGRESRVQQLKYLSWLTRDHLYFAFQYRSVSKNALDAYPESVSASNSPAEAATIATYNIRQAFAQQDVFDAQKEILASLQGGQNSPSYAALVARADPATYIPTDARAIAASGDDPAPTGSSQPQVYWYSYTDYHGAPASTWIASTATLKR